jgi:hypothetical protein
VGRSERIQFAAAAQRLEAAIGASRGKLEDATPVVTTANPQAYTLATLTGAGIDKIEVGLVLLVALLVEIGGLGPFMTMNLAKVPKEVKVPTRSPLAQKVVSEPSARGGSTVPPSLGPQRPTLIHSAAVAAPENLQGDLERFLNRYARHDRWSAVGSSDLLARYNCSRRERVLPEISHRRLGEAMGVLGHSIKVRLAGGRIHYQGFAWVEENAGLRRSSIDGPPQLRPEPQRASRYKNGGDGKHGVSAAARLVP